MLKCCIKITVILISLTILSLVTSDSRAAAQSTIKLQGTDVKYFNLTPDKLATITRAHKQKHAVFIYASWCPACRSYLPRMIDIEQTKAGSVFFVSLDKDNGALQRYLGSLAQLPPHVIVSKVQRKSMESAYGIKPARGIPLTIIFDANGNVYDSGFLKPEYTAKYLLAGH